ncbi:hypothetical protein LTR78_000407 [Recurvomyces mirabilis]|uniref:Ams2/SPT21 N-terminal domain-containing protein n=1 Tax=Recurvomyces mirabilis TaxID=574656 RepID=A0AAE1C6F5_9PEZI|nr:hypothetical protein LTR78_000407 [Recurvomyces mirabilis]KAK5162062.1 hypothetical protein LTS14_000408 [Recurvomyces mirabilis]
MDFDSSSDGSAYGDIPTRPMRVKVLYSFDQDKTNCLARFPNTLQIPAVAIDESSQVGVIELQQCIQAIVTASPEIVSRLTDGDFTVYAFDYSEPDTPLVGQGMLSVALAQTSAPITSKKVMITGRVCKNLPALFSNGVKETLEVKLRLAPVAKPTTTVMTKPSTPATSAGFDPNAWNASVNQSRPSQLTSSYFDFDASQSGTDSGMALMDEMFGLGGGTSGSSSGQQTAGCVGIAETPNEPTFGISPAFSHSAPGSRAGSPMMGFDSDIHNDQLRHNSFSVHAPTFADQSRPGSRASVRSEVRPSQHQRQASVQSLPPQALQSQSEQYFNEDGQPRKRAKVTQADWRGRSSFGAKSADLRVTAATAHSVQMHRPVPRRPGMPGNDLEPPPRVPTPVPQMHPIMRQQQRPSRSFLRQASTMTSDTDNLSDAGQFSDALISDEESPNMSNTAESTPQNMPSSPPVPMGPSTVEPSSPGLPMLPTNRMLDSGYMSERGIRSGNVAECDDEDDENRSPTAEDLEMAAQYHARGKQAAIKKQSAEPTAAAPSEFGFSEMNVELETPGDMDQLPQRMLINMPPGRNRQGSQGPKPLKASASSKIYTTTSTSAGTATTEQAQRPSMAASRRSSLALPTNSHATASSEQDQRASLMPEQRPTLNKRKSTKRSRAELQGSEAGSPAPSDTEGRPKGSRRSGSGAQRRIIIQQRLEASLANGETPTFCSHCGAIETPTWRKLYVKHCDGEPSPLDKAEGEGETIGVEETSFDPQTGVATAFVIRKSMKKTKESTPGEGFKDTVVCNPCGLWFNKFRSMRPRDKWNRKSTRRISKKAKGTPGGDLMTDGLEPPSEAFFTDQVDPDDASEENQDMGSAQFDGAASNPPPKPTMGQRPRANSLQTQTRRQSADGPNASQLDAALARAVQSSPAPFRGSQASPIEVDELTPRPTRRLLFPSPRRDGEVKSLDDNGQASLHATPSSTKGSAARTLNTFDSKTLPDGGIEVNIFEAFTFDKENLEPGMELDADLMHLFEGSPQYTFKTPSKKTPRSKPHTTPPRSSQRQFEQLLKTPTPGSRKRKPLSPNPNAALNPHVAAAAQGAINDFMTSPSSSRYFLRSTPSRVERTPGGGRNTAHSSGGRAADMTPFSRYLAQMATEGGAGAAAAGSAFMTSPSRALDFSDLPGGFGSGSPGMGQGMDWSGMEEILSSEFAAFEGNGGAGQGSGEDTQA